MANAVMTWQWMLPSGLCWEPGLRTISGTETPKQFAADMPANHAQDNSLSASRFANGPRPPLIEIADLLATAWLRGLSPSSQVTCTDAVTLCDTRVETEPVRLGFTADQRVNTNPSRPEGVQ
jgi:hypothetical protein